MRLDDFIMLGKTVPEPNSDGRVFVCSAGYSPELDQLVRIYPLSRFASPKRWSVNTIELERNPRDSRPNSWRIKGDRHEGHDLINQRFETTGHLPEGERPGFLDAFRVGSIVEANDRRMSLAVIHPHDPAMTIEHNPESPDSPELRLFDTGDRPTSGSKRFPYLPRISFTDDLGKPHHLSLRDWGCFEFMRKHPGNEQSLNPHLRYDSTLLIGNLNHHRNSWLVISVLNGLVKPQQLDIFGDTA